MKYIAHALTRKGVRTYTSPAFPTREEAIEDARKARPNHWRISSGHGYDGCANILWTEPNYESYNA
jgi:methylmalonyl-CoA mutase cobalamin-binding subunit